MGSSLQEDYLEKLKIICAGDARPARAGACAFQQKIMSLLLRGPCIVQDA